ncbi:geranylgeranyl reductase family protein [Corynebacterium sp. 3HC-13]|uniref:geranylgeranyl reductase family protein n=1 Tax=Corynebacterium poyangense TaxID=2684405 RepID=UPI001CCFB404|nr:geranylgeranyl reductase family protein [Corynebacterium poyangense]MBZ8177662.1 geranylgeranyl reductase family protein [Corynebacterium poyangense]
MTDDIQQVEVLVIGAGPAGATAALHAAQQGYEVLLCDSAPFPRDKTCGDGLTPRALKQLRDLNIAERVLPPFRTDGLVLHGFGSDIYAPWPDSIFGKEGSAVPRQQFDHALVQEAIRCGVTFWGGAKARQARVDHGRLEHIQVGEKLIKPKFALVCDGVRSPVGKELGREWQQQEVYGIAARSYCTTPRAEEPWIHSHAELRSEDGKIQPGYGWIFPLGGEQGKVNLGCGALSTSARPAKINTKNLLEFYAAQQREEWQLGAPEQVTSALLPMGGSISGVAGKNWALVGDAAALVNPLNGEGIDYGMESAQLAVMMMASQKNPDFRRQWPEILRAEFGTAFLLGRTIARALTLPRFLPIAGSLALKEPIGPRLMPVAARLMGNLISEEDQDLVARIWRATGHSATSWRYIRRQLGRSITPLWGEQI